MSAQKPVAKKVDRQYYEPNPNCWVRMDLFKNLESENERLKEELKEKNKTYDDNSSVKMGQVVKMMEYLTNEVTDLRAKLLQYEHNGIPLKKSKIK